MLVVHVARCQLGRKHIQTSDAKGEDSFVWVKSERPDHRVGDQSHVGRVTIPIPEQAVGRCSEVVHSISSILSWRVLDDSLPLAKDDTERRQAALFHPRRYPSACSTETTHLRLPSPRWRKLSAPWTHIARVVITVGTVLLRRVRCNCHGCLIWYRHRSERFLDAIIRLKRIDTWARVVRADLFHHLAMGLFGTEEKRHVLGRESDATGHAPLALPFKPVGGIAVLTWEVDERREGPEWIIRIPGAEPLPEELLEDRMSCAVPVDIPYPCSTGLGDPVLVETDAVSAPSSCNQAIEPVQGYLAEADNSLGVSERIEVAGGSEWPSPWLQPTGI